MPHSNLSPCSVVPYSKDYLIEFIRHKTGWDQRNEVSDKTQLNYLCKYLEIDHINCKTIIVEDEYIDRHYLEDYSEYYARCFPSHPRKCSRLHFFSEEIEEHAFISGLASRQAEFQNGLAKSYIGFAVIRPIPHTFLAKVCLKPYDILVSDSEYRVITKTTTVSLFGIPLSVKTTPFLEQDKVVSACATSALWTALSASPYMSHINLPSPSAITKSASHPHLEGTRTFPTTGLTPMQVARSFKHYGLEPTIYSFASTADFADLKEHIYSYINSDTPVLIGGDVYQLVPKKPRYVGSELVTDNEYRYLGKHLICAVGYHIEECEHRDGLRLLSHEIDKLYVHDDRYGPFVKVKMAPEKIIVDKKEKSGLALSLHGDQVDLFVPEIAVVGLYHKVRIPYIYIRDVCVALYDHLTIASQQIDELLTEATLPDEDAKSHYKHAGESISTLLQGVWDISLTTSTAIKEELLKTDDFGTFNGVVNRTSLLLQNMPKYVWRCRVFARPNHEKQKFTDILFDATEVPQGRVLIGYISYNTDAQKMWNYIEALIDDRMWQNQPSDARTKQLIGCIIKFFGELKGKTYLNTLYGSPGLPRRSLKPGEADTQQNIKLRKDTYTVRRGGDGSAWTHLDKKIKYIWVINELGDIVLGEDVQDDDGFKGHPTLIDGKPGRVAGELFYSEEKGLWLLNHRSRAYSGHLAPKSDEGHAYLNHVITYNLVGLSVEIEGETTA
jgi:hypothetical protein